MWADNKNRTLIRTLKGLAVAGYTLLKLLPVRNKVSLISRHNKVISTDFALLKNEINRQHPHTKVVVLNHRRKRKSRHALDILVEMYHLATSRAVVVDSYVIPVCVLTHRRNLIIVQIWHAVGTIKQFGHIALGKPDGHSPEIARIMNMHRNYTYITCGSEAMVPVYAQTFNVKPETIKPIGAPRIDYLLDKKQQKQNRTQIKKRFALPADKEVILYAPTFRKHRKIAMQKLIDAIDRSRYVLIIKHHHHDKTTLEPQEGVIAIKNQASALDLIQASDYIITDYSAVAFEAAILGKPLFFWTYDYDRYIDECGFVLDYEAEMPGFISSNVQEIVKAVYNSKCSPDTVSSFGKKYVSVQDGTCTKRVVELLEL